MSQEESIPYQKIKKELKDFSLLMIPTCINILGLEALSSMHSPIENVLKTAWYTAGHYMLTVAFKD